MVKFVSHFGKYLEGAGDMAIERTLSIIKPDAVEKQVIGKIIDRFESNGLRIAGMKKIKLTKEDASTFYAVHKDRPFFNDLVEYMTSGPVVVMVLEGEDAVAKNRKLMGATNPKEAEPGTIRADFAESIEANAVHGSDSLENAQKEIRFFFAEREIL
jgi:nucleoside-diphosphate kinase